VAAPLFRHHHHHLANKNDLVLGWFKKNQKSKLLKKILAYNARIIPYVVLKNGKFDKIL